MKRPARIWTALGYSFIIAVVMVTWVFVVLTSIPLSRLGGTPEQDIADIREEHSVCLVDPEEVISDAGLGWSDWAWQEFRARAKVAPIIWLAFAVAAMVWAICPRKSAAEKDGHDDAGQQ